jgi:nucleotide-binding universal stress UspA family protein
MFKKIVAAVDGSKQGLKAAEVASQMAQRFEAKLVLLTVTRPIKMTPEVRRYMEIEHLTGEPQYVLDEMTEQVLSEAKRCALEAGLADIQTVVKEGHEARTILDYAKRNGVDLIVLGSRGLGDIGAFLLGSVSHKVSSLAPCPVMVVR